MQASKMLISSRSDRWSTVGDPASRATSASTGTSRRTAGQAEYAVLRKLSQVWDTGEYVEDLAALVSPGPKPSDRAAG